jgi:hypothetical protein
LTLRPGDRNLPRFSSIFPETFLKLSRLTVQTVQQTSDGKPVVRGES